MTHRRFCCRKEGQATKPKPRYVECISMSDTDFTIINFLFYPHSAKHPVKVHVWAGISRRGRTGICIFEGIMDRFLFTDILDNTLVPFVISTYPDSHRFMHDSDPKHASHYARDFLVNKGINWWKTPAESPDLNPIENLWHEMRICSKRSQAQNKARTN